MRSLIFTATFAALLASTTVMSQSAPSAALVATVYTTADTEIGILLDDPAARTIVDKYIPGFSSGENVDMARSMTLRGIQPFAPDTVTDEVLANIDADLAKLAEK